MLLVLVAACGTPPVEPPPTTTEPLPTRARVLTDSQYAHAIRDLLGDVTPAMEVRVPGTRPHQFLHDGLVAVDAALLAQYRVAAESIAREVARTPAACTDDDPACARAEITAFTERAFRRPLEPGELEQLAAIYAQAPTAAEGWSYVVETVLQAPSFVYRTELGVGTGVVELTPWETAAELAFWLLDSIPDDELASVARDGSLAKPEVLSAQVDRLLATERVRTRIDDLVLDWFEVRRVFEVPDPRFLEPIERSRRQQMFDETSRFVHRVLWQRDGSLHTLLTSTEGLDDPAHRAGLLTHASVLTALGTPRVSTIERGMFVNRKLLCTEELGRPPFAAIAEVFPLTGYLSDSQFAHYRAADLYCSGCHRVIDPPGRALLAFDHAGAWRERDEYDVPIEADIRLAIDDEIRPIAGARELAHVLAESGQVARCVVDQLAHHALGARLTDSATREYLYRRFEANDRDLIDLLRAIATSPAFRTRGAP